MTDASYRVVPRGKSGFDVEIDKPDGRKQTVPGFQSEHEADAWIIQAKRMIREASPWTPLAPRRPPSAVAGEAPKPKLPSPPEPSPVASSAPGPSPLVSSAQADSTAADPAPAPRSRAKATRESSTA
jgi:hypothetical protein